MTTRTHNRTDPSQNYIARAPQLLDAVFLPDSVAIIGAKDDPGTVGATITNNLVSGGFEGRIYPVNPKRKQVMGLTCYPSIGHVPEPVDLVVIVTPAVTVPHLVAECVAAKARAAIVISAGFKELGPQGLELEEEILRQARVGNLPIVGPNCLGVMNPHVHLNATFASRMALPGNVAFISQSGAMCTAVLDWSFREKIGFSAFVSIGSMADVNWGTLIDYLGSDPHTHSLLLYMETVGDARAFMTAAREVALEKPIIVIKPGRSQAAAKAAASHTGSLAGSDEVFDAALERVGVLRVNTISELFSMASVLSRQPRPKGPHLTIVTNAGGPAVLATDATAISQAQMTQLDPVTIERLNAHLPAAWSHSNPIDILGDATPKRYAETLEVLVTDQKTDGVLVILSPQDMTDPTETARCVVPYAKMDGKPLLTSWMGGDSVAEGVRLLTEAEIPVFEYPDDAAKTFATMWRYSENLKRLYETSATTPSENFDEERFKMEAGRHLIEQVQREGRHLLTEAESKQLLAAYGIPVVETVVAHSLDEAVAAAESLGYPIVLKLHSETITHKSDVGGVKLNLLSAVEVAAAYEAIKSSVKRLAGEHHFGGVTVQRMVDRSGYELILGSSTDVQFGPVILFGMGGQLVEVFKDRALAIPPLTKNLARRLMEKTKIYEALHGVRGRGAVDIDALEQLLIDFSRMIVENPRIAECDINPLMVSEKEMIALDARIVLNDQSIPDSRLPKSAIRPYPLKYVTYSTLKNGKPIVLRPIRPEDEELIVAFHKELSEHSVRQRFFEFMSLDERVAHERLIRICFTDYDREWSIVAEVTTAKASQIIGVAKLFRIPGTARARFTMVIIDPYHNLGLGTQLLRQLLHIAQQERIGIIEAAILSENTGMITICQRAGFHLSQGTDPDIILAQWNSQSRPVQ